MYLNAPTPNMEQAAIGAASRAMKPGDLMQIKAYAGGGKTTLLWQLSQIHSSTQILYLCFNADLAREAKTKFPSWVRCSTIHALAYASEGRIYASAGKLLSGTLKPKDVMEVLGLTDQIQAQYVTAALLAFLCSPDDKPDRTHLEAGGWNEDEEDQESALELVKTLWDRMQDPTDKAALITHDGYLKVWSLKDPDLSFYDLILIDESQDLNPVTLKAVLMQREKGSRLVFVGDTHQSLYGWRGSVNAMEAIENIATHKFALTECFRFGQQIADFASALLKAYKADPVRLVGKGGARTSEAASHCFIARTNGKLLGRALDGVQSGRKLHFAATRAEDRWSPWGPYKFQEMLDVWNLFSGNRSAVKTPWIAKFTSFAEANGFAQGNEEGKGGDAELKSMIDFVAKHGMETRRVLDLVCVNCTSPALADLHLSSAHRSKGKEWTNVTLADDFIPLDDRQKMEKLRAKSSPREFAESVNVLYVAITRAKRMINLPSSSVRFFTENDQHLRAS